MSSKLGEIRDCTGCGRQVFVPKHRLTSPTIGTLCMECRIKGVDTPWQEDKKPKQEEKKEEPILLSCPHCTIGQFFKVGDELTCIQCGWVRYD